MPLHLLASNLTNFNVIHYLSGKDIEYLSWYESEN